MGRESLSLPLIKTNGTQSDLDYKTFSLFPITDYFGLLPTRRFGQHSHMRIQITVLLNLHKDEKGALKPPPTGRVDDSTWLEVRE